MHTLRSGNDLFSAYEDVKGVTQLWVVLARHRVERADLRIREATGRPSSHRWEMIGHNPDISEGSEDLLGFSVECDRVQ